MNEKISSVIFELDIKVLIFASLKFKSRNTVKSTKSNLKEEELAAVVRRLFFKIGVIKNFANCTGKHLCWSLFLIKPQAWWCDFIRETPTQVFSCEIYEISGLRLY